MGLKPMDIACSLGQSATQVPASKALLCKLEAARRGKVLGSVPGKGFEYHGPQYGIDWNSRNSLDAHLSALLLLFFGGGMGQIQRHDRYGFPFFGGLIERTG